LKTSETKCNKISENNGMSAQMSLRQKAIKEIKAVGLLTFYFAAWFGILLFIKRLMLEEYEIQFRGISIALLAALVVAKVVIVAEHISLGRWVRLQPVAVDVALRSGLYTVGVLVVFLLEKAFESRHEMGGFGQALLRVFHHRDIHHVWAATICVGGSLLGFNIICALRRHFGGAELKRLFLGVPLAELEARETAGTGVITAEKTL
jgi:hypothetical protein